MPQLTFRNLSSATQSGWAVLEEPLIEVHFNLKRICHPMDESLWLHFHLFDWDAFYFHLHHFPIPLLNVDGLQDEAGITEANREASVAFLPNLFEITLFDVNFWTEGHFVRSHLWRIRKIWDLEFLLQIFRIDELDLEQFQHHHRPLGAHIQVAANKGLQHRWVNRHLSTCDTHSGAESVDGLRWKPSSSQGGEGEQPRVIPIGTHVGWDEFPDLALAHNCVVDVEPPVLQLDGAVGLDSIAQPVVTAPPCLELLGAEGEGDVLHGITQAVSVVVGGVDASLVLGTVMVSILDPVDHRILLTLLQRCPHPQSCIALFELPIFHILKQPQRLVNRSVPPWRQSWIESSNILNLLVTDISHSFSDQQLKKNLQSTLNPHCGRIHPCGGWIKTDRHFVLRRVRIFSRKQWCNKWFSHHGRWFPPKKQKTWKQVISGMGSGFWAMPHGQLGGIWVACPRSIAHYPEPMPPITSFSRFLGEIVASRMSWSGRRVGLEYVLSGRSAQASRVGNFDLLNLIFALEEPCCLRGAQQDPWWE